MEPPEVPDQHASTHQLVNTVQPQPVKQESQRTLRSAGRKSHQASSLLDEFRAEELQTLSHLLPETAATRAVGYEGQHSDSPASPPSASTVGSQPTVDEQTSPQIMPRALTRAGTKRSSRHTEQLTEADILAADEGSKHVSSTFRGVYKRKFDMKWRAEITAGRRKRCLGSFSSEREAAEAYDKAALTLRGPAAFTNFPADHYASVSTRNEPVKGRSGMALKDRRFMGVTWCPSQQQYEARIWTRSGEEHQLVGMFDTPEAAAHAYDQAALKMHGPEAYTNFLLKSEAGTQRGTFTGPTRAGQIARTGLTVTVKASALSKAPSGKGSSKFRGVSWHKDNMKWRATIFKGSKPVHIGYFDSQQDAARAYDQEAIRLRGPNTSLNYPITDYDVGAPADPELDGDSLSPEGSSFSPSPTPRGLLPEGSFVDESGRLVGPAGVAPLGTLGAPRLDARLVAVFSPRSSPAGLSDDMESRDVGSRAGSEGGYPSHTPPGVLLEGSDAGPSSSADLGLPAAAPSLQALMQSNPNILKTIQVNEAKGALSKRGRPVGKSAQARSVDSRQPLKPPPSTRGGRPPLSRQSSRLQRSHSSTHNASPDFTAGHSSADCNTPDDEETQTAPSAAEFEDDYGSDEARPEPVDVLAAAAATLAGCKKDKQVNLPMWGHKGRRTQGHELSGDDLDQPDASVSGSRTQREVESVYQRGEGTGRNLRPRSAKRTWSD